MNTIKYVLCVQCTDSNSNQVGDFISETESKPFKASSPVFESLLPLYEWMRANNYASSPDGFIYKVAQ